MKEPSLEFHLLNPNAAAKRHSIWEIEYYQPWFNIDSSDVLLRLQGALLLQPSMDFFELIQDRPDLYGPFWISTSALFFTFITSSIMTLFTQDTKPIGLHHIGLAAFFLYIILLGWPSFAYLALAYYTPPSSSSHLPSWTQWVCIYGYALASLLPFSILAVIVLPFVRHHAWLLWAWQWMALLLALGMSSWFIIRNVWPFFGPLKRETKTMLLTMLFTLHALLFLIFKLLFF